MYLALVFLWILGIAVVFVMLTVGGAWWSARTPRAVRCPDDGKPARIRLDPRRSVRALFTGEPERVVTCTRWPEHAACSRRCANRR